MKTERIHSLDSLRAIMMLLGVVLHASINYGTLQYGIWPMKSPTETSLVNDYIVSFIHSFRMPIFFLVAGFFGAMLYYKKGPIGMMGNRISRILFPFVVSLFILMPIILYVMKGSPLYRSDIGTYDNLFSRFRDFSFFAPSRIITFHLWFLYYLIMVSAVAVVIMKVFEKFPFFYRRIDSVFYWVIGRPVIRVILFAFITFFPYPYAHATFSLLPDLPCFLFQFHFYMIGWFFYRSKYSIAALKKYDLMTTLIAVLIFTFTFFFGAWPNRLVGIFVDSLTVWLFIFGITGLFVRFTNKFSPGMRYVSDSSYWVYLVHYPITMFIPGIMVDWTLHPIIKFLIVSLVTLIICFVSYHFLVRSTLIGKFLNGRKYTRKPNDINDIKLDTSVKELESAT